MRGATSTVDLGAVSSEFDINTTHTNNQSDVSLAALASGYVAAFTDLSGANADIRLRLFNAAGVGQGNDIIVDTGNNFADSEADVTVLNDGKIVVTWTRDFGGGNTDIRYALHNTDGSVILALGQAFSTTEHSTGSTVAALGDGGFVVAWQTDTGGNAKVQFRRFNKDGVAADNFTPTTAALIDATGDNTDIQVVGLADGGFVVAYADTGWNVDGTEITARVFNANGSTRSSFIQVNTGNVFTVGDQLKPSLTALSNGGFAVSFAHNGVDERMKIFDAQGAMLIDGHLAIGGGVIEGEIAGLSGGRVANVYQSNTPDAGGDNSIRANTIEIFRNVTGDATSETIVAINDDFRDSFNGGDGIDFVSYANASVGITASLGSPGTNTGAAARDTYLAIEGLIGTPFDDTLVGNFSANTLIGGGGNDWLDGGDGADTMIGGVGDDTYVRTSQSDVLQEAANEGIDTVRSSLTYTLLPNFEKLTLTGSNAIDGTGNDLDNTIIGNGNENTLNGLGGADVMAGGGADDTYFIDTAGDLIVENANEGTDIVGSYISFTLPENVEYLVLLSGTGDINGTGNAGNNIIIGNQGNNVLTGAGGSDLIDGSDGDDTAVFANSFSQYTLSQSGAKINVIGPEGAATLGNIEHIQFANGTLHLNDGSALFDTLYYMTHNIDVFNAGADALQHYNGWGWHEGRDPNAFFDTDGYLAVNKDVAAAGINPLDHYHQQGWKEGRDPGANFDTTLYLIRNPDVAAAGTDPLAHYLEFGMAEGRKAWAAVGPISAGFDAQYYLFHNPDVAAANVDPLQHFNTFGWHEGRNPNGWFDTAGYLSHYNDVAAAGINPLDHYMSYGWQEGRDPSAAFDTLGYLAANGDVAAAGFNPLQHFLQFGIYEGRTAVDDGVFH